MRVLFSFFLFSIFLFSCTLESVESEKIILDKKLEWAKCNDTDTIYESENADFKPLDVSKAHSLKKLVDRDGEFVWVRAKFSVPESLKFKSLGLVISYVHFADKVWLNNVYVGGYGRFPPNERSALWASHCYLLPDNAISDSGENTILMKIWCRGKSDVSKIFFVTEYDEAQIVSQKIGFWKSRVFLLCAGWMLCAAVISFLIFIWKRQEREYLAFAILNCATVVFLTPFFVTEIPWYSDSPVSYFSFIKSTLCVSFYWVCLFASIFIMKFLHIKISKAVIIAMFSQAVLISVLTLAMPDYGTLMNVSPYFLSAILVEFVPAFTEFVRALKNKRRRKSAFTLLLGFSPFLLCVLVDIIVRVGFQNTEYPFFSAFGWQLSIFAFLILMSIRYNQVYARYAYLSSNLRKEVSEKTKSLSKANEKLESEIKKSTIDLEMASILQEKFFPAPDRAFRGWDIAVCYKAATLVSGDLYDYYNTDDRLDGIALFDVSGHGIASSLITMLAKHIVHRAFKDSILQNQKNVSDTLYRINNQIIESKGEIENYLTGILMKIGDFDENDVCALEMANAGHPHPILYNAQNQETIEIEPKKDQKQYGAIGLKNIDVSFPEINFYMARGDIFVCYTDGLTEAMNKKREEFGKERVMEVIKSSAPKDALSILEDLIDSLDSFTEGVPRDDDLTIIILKRERSNDYLEELMAE